MHRTRLEDPIPRGSKRPDIMLDEKLLVFLDVHPPKRVFHAPDPGFQRVQVT